MPQQLRPLTVGEARAIHERLVNLTPAEREKMRQIKQHADAELDRLYAECSRKATFLDKLADEDLRNYQEGK